MIVITCPKCGRYRFDGKDKWINPASNEHCSISPIATASILGTILGGLENKEEICPNCTKQKD